MLPCKLPVGPHAMHLWVRGVMVFVGKGLSCISRNKFQGALCSAFCSQVSSGQEVPVVSMYLRFHFSLERHSAKVLQNI